jgi:hypothetical protein
MLWFAARAVLNTAMAARSRVPSLVNFIGSFGSRE